MADYQPPTENLPEFNPAVFRTNDTPLTIAEAERLFVSFPTAQGNVNLSSVSIAGDLTTTKDAHNLGFGYQALSNAVTGSAVDNTAFGYQALKALDVGDSNTAFGDLALPNLTGGAGLRNTGVGHQSGLNLQNGSDNTFVGFNAGRGTGGLRTGSSSNVGVGSDALKNLTTGQSNTAVGTDSASVLTTGTANTFIGGSAGLSVVGGSNNTLIGYGANASASTSTSVAIGYNSVVSADNTIVLGTSSQIVRFNTLRPLTDGGDVSIGTTSSDTLRYYKATPLYTAIPFGVNNIGYQYSLALTFTTPAIGANIATSASLPIGLWMFDIHFAFTGVWNSSSVVLASGITTYGIFPIVATTTNVTSAGCCGSTIVSNTSASVFTLIYNSNITSTLTLYTTGGNTSQLLITRIA